MEKLREVARSAIPDGPAEEVTVLMTDPLNPLTLRSVVFCVALRVFPRTARICGSCALDVDAHGSALTELDDMNVPM